MGIEEIEEEEEEVEETSENTEGNHKEDLVLTKETKISDLFSRYPQLKNRMEEINPGFKTLKIPLGKVMIKKATIGHASDRTGMPLDELIEHINKLINEIKGK
ncbi:protein of unknown function [Clostridium sp. DSM 8431]|uniref:DUF1858 domain-containing protein n=1 Tax=Clostridium sp. DSM 8431 TaxID=1761781 RepID=UPI0008E4BFF5|nr:DUF1858 domain-containing protein [Clostridium sp. DSM 8431]SFU75263.1 protein of unknown function [Clostridium sp. DSM 8431]